jgi:hypothetical protein
MVDILPNKKHFRYVCLYKSIAFQVIVRNEDDYLVIKISYFVWKSLWKIVQGPCLLQKKFSNPFLPDMTR